MAVKRYYWLKLKEDFFADPRIKKLRRIAGGDTYTVILLKLMLLTVKADGVLVYEGIEQTLSQELALKMDEDDKNVEATLIYMRSMHLIQEIDPETYDIPQVREMTGSETDSAERKRQQRAKSKDNSVTLSHQSHTLVTGCHKNVTTDTETETEKETELEIDTETEIENDPLFSKWLDEYSVNAKNPPAYKASMRKRIRAGNRDAQAAFLTWRSEYLDQKEKEEAKKKIEEFDYTQLVGHSLGNRQINRVVDIGSHLHLFFDDGTDDYGYTKKDLYLWIHQKSQQKQKSA